MTCAPLHLQQVGASGYLQRHGRVTQIVDPEPADRPLAR